MKTTERTWQEELKESLKDIVMDNIHLGIEIQKLKGEYFYDKLIAYLRGDNSGTGSMYLYNLKPLYDKYGYEKVNSVLLKLEDEETGKGEEKGE